VDSAAAQRHAYGMIESVPFFQETCMPLSKSQRQHLEHRLLEERRRVLTDLGAYTEFAESTERERSGDLTVVPLHAADLGTDANREELAAANASRESAELEEIDAALERLYHSPERYGIDEASGEEISFERLDIIPWARTNGRSGSRR
jgi:RNA polymerase-binding transcription factor DksA